MEILPLLLLLERKDFVWFFQAYLFLFVVIISNEEGSYIIDAVWEPPLLYGKYDIVTDVNRNGKYDAGIDTLDDVDIGTAGFFVIPEYSLGVILGLVDASQPMVCSMHRDKVFATIKSTTRGGDDIEENCFWKARN